MSTSWLKLFYKALKSLSVDKIRACDYLTFLTRLQGCKYQTLKTWIVSNKWASKTLSVNIDRFTPLCWFWLLDWQFKYSSSHDFIHILCTRLQMMQKLFDVHRWPIAEKILSTKWIFLNICFNIRNFVLGIHYTNWFSFELI